MSFSKIMVLGFWLMGCSVSHAYVFPKEVQEHYIITSGDVDCAYQSLGYVQISRSGANIVGFIPVVDADLDKMFGELVIEEMKRAQADGIINMRYWERQWTVAQKIFFAFPLFFVPLPTYVELTGELVRIGPEARGSCHKKAPPPSNAATATKAPLDS